MAFQNRVPTSLDQTQGASAVNRFSKPVKPQAESELEGAYDRWFEILRHSGESESDKHWGVKEGANLPPKPSPNDKLYILGATVELCDDGYVVQAHCEWAEPQQAQDAEGNAITIRCRTIGKSRTGEPVFCDFFVPLYSLAESVETPGWLPNFPAILESLRDVIAEEKARDIRQRQRRKEEEKLLQQLHASKRDPSASLGTAISVGVARALAELGVAPKSRTAKGGAA